MLLIFDLDGTLIDSSGDLVASLNTTLSHLGRRSLDAATVISYVGNGARVLVQRALGPEASEAESAAALDFFLRHYGAHPVVHTRLYPGLRTALEDASAARHTLAVLTNKPHELSLEILDRLEIAVYFRQVVGGGLLPANKPQPVGIRHLMNLTGYGESETVMIGDSAVDVQTARNAGVKAWGVKWGFQPAGFLEHVPDRLLASAEELMQAVNEAATETLTGA